MPVQKKIKIAQFSVIPLGNDLSIFSNLNENRKKFRKEINASDNEMVMRIIGRLTEVKNHELFLRAVKLIKENADFAKIKFVIIDDGHLRNYLEISAEKTGIKEQVIFLGNRNDADIFYAGLDVGVLTSLNEGTPLTLIEAMASKKPVISTKVGGVVDLLGKQIEDKKNFAIYERGLGINSDDPQDLMQAILYLYKNHSLRTELSKKGEEFVGNNYDKARLISDIKKLYKDFIKT